MNYHARGRRLLRYCLLGFAIGVGASNATAQSLPGSNFEIDNDANLTSQGKMDWSTVVEMRQEDEFIGQQDDSFGQGTKEDTPVPTVTNGSIPPNKSDLRFFGLYQEGASSAGFLHLFWTRVQDPSGTTNMDFEFNQKGLGPLDLSANGVTPIRTPGDMLITYDLSKGGTVPVLSLRRWTGSAWSNAVNLSETDDATGSINTSEILAADSDSLGHLDPRTFGEASIDLSAVFDPNVCSSFGSAYLKSRSSDSFTAAVKDFIAPVKIDIRNCAALTIIKQDDSSTPVALNDVEFTLYNDVNSDGSGPEDTATNYTCTTGVGGISGQCTILNILPGDYCIVETKPLDGYSPAPAQCLTISADQSVTKWFTNPRKPGTINIAKVDDDNPPNPLKDAIFTLFNDDAGTIPGYDSDQDSTTGKMCKTEADGKCSFANIYPGAYCVVETTTPIGYETAAPQCFSLVLDQTLDLPDFVDKRKKATVNFLKVDDDEPASPLSGAVFTLYSDDAGAIPGYDDEHDSTTGLTCTTGGDGKCAFSNLYPGSYCIVETKTPTGHETAAPQCFSLRLDQTLELPPFVDKRKPATIDVLKLDDASSPNPLSGAVFTLYNDDAGLIPGYDDEQDNTTGRTCQTGGDGTCSITNILPPGNYCLVETTPPVGYETAAPKCFSLALDQTLPLTFVDKRKRGAILITKTRKHAALGSGDHPHTGVKFTITGGELATGVDVFTDGNGEACVDDLLLSTLPGVGQYTVTEDVPTGYKPDGAAAKNVSVTAVATCNEGEKATVSFGNTPLTDITVIVNSQVDGGTASTVSCVNSVPAQISGGSTGVNGDGEFKASDLLPGTYVCTIVVDP